MRKKRRSPLRIGLFGGSFDPVHFGHLKLAQAARKEFKLDCVIFIPAYLPPHKLTKKLIPAADRLVMLYLAVRPYPGFCLSRFELKRRSTTYTFQTIGHFRRLLPGAELFFIIGSDSLLELGTWKHIDRLLSSCTFIVGRRTGVSLGKKTPYADRVKLTRARIPAVSSSEIRERIRQGRPITKYVPPAVENYIASHELYR